MRAHFNDKHKHLREPLLRFYLKHTKSQCLKKFKLTESEFKSCLTAAYRETHLKEIRKETRTHEPWDTAAWLFVVRRCGIIERKKIAKLSGRSTGERFHSVKERMRTAGGGNTKFLNGIPLSWAEQIWPRDLILNTAIKTQSGPTGRRGDFRFLIIPWVEAQRLSEVFHTDESVRRCIGAMAQFQRFIHQKKDRIILKQIRRIARVGK